MGGMLSEESVIFPCKVRIFCLWDFLNAIAHSHEVELLIFFFLFSELIAKSREDYVKISVRLGNDPEL
jgi:hypothetical protein